MTYLFLIRHGETPWTKHKRFQGSTDTRLTPHGKRQAVAVGKCLKRFGVDALYSSDLTRARQTASLISKAIGRKPHWDRRLRELGFGTWEGRTSAELLKDKNSSYRKWCKGIAVNPPGGEKIKDFRNRVGQFLKQSANRHKDKKIAIVTHGGPVKMFIYEALRLPFRSLWSFRIDTASITILGLGPHFASVFCLNDVSHLSHQLASKPEYIGR